MEKIGFDFENVGGLAECYAIPVNVFKRIRVDYLRGLRNLELKDRSSVIAIPMYADDSFSHKEEKKHAAAGDYWEVDIEGLVPKWCKGVEGQLEVLDRGEWLVLSRDNNGTVRLSGSVDVPLWFESERNTGMGYSDRNGTTFHFTGNQPKPSMTLDMDDLSEL